MTDSVTPEKRIPSPDMLRQWADDPQQTQCWGLAAVADRLDRMKKIIEDYADHQRPACRDIPEAEAKAGFCYCGLSAALKEAGTMNEPPMAMLPNDHHPGPRCACRDCLRRYSDSRVDRQPTVPSSKQRCKWCYGTQHVQISGCTALQSDKLLETFYAACHRDVGDAWEILQLGIAGNLAPLESRKTEAEDRRGSVATQITASSSVETISDDMRDAGRYRYIRQGEDVLSPEDEDHYAEMWQKIWVKGCDREKMDAVVDRAMARSSSVKALEELPESLRDPLRVMERVRAMPSESSLAEAIRIARGDVGPPDEPVRFAQETSNYADYQQALREIATCSDLSLAGVNRMRQIARDALSMPPPAQSPNIDPDKLCSDCPPVGYSTDETRCFSCPRSSMKASAPLQRDHHCEQSRVGYSSEDETGPDSV